MPDNLALIIALVAPVIVLVALRINAALVFLSLCLGAVLVQYVAGEANSLLSLFSAKTGSVSAASVQLVLLFAAALVTCVLTVFSVRGEIKISLNVLPAVAATLLALLLAVPLLAPGLRYAIEGQALWRQLTNAQALVVGLGAVISLFFLWTQRATFRSKDKRRK